MVDTGGPLLQLTALTRTFGTGQTARRVLHGIDLRIDAGEFVALVGPSGSGKSTLLNQLGLLDHPTGGELHVAGQDTSRLPEDARTALRARTLGFIFQHHMLVPAFSVLDNVAMPLRLTGGLSAANIQTRARQALARVGLAERAASPPAELSGGQQQRVAIARALVHRPAIVLADEPTGNLDTATAQDIFQLMRDLNQETAAAFIIVTHDERLAARCDRVVSLLDGRIVGDRPGMLPSSDVDHTFKR